MVMPMTRSPARFSMPATTELSTPPDIATAMVCSDIGRRQLSETSHYLNHRVDQRVDLLRRVRAAQRKTHARPGLFACESDSSQHMRGFGGAARTGRSAGYREALEVERNQQRLAIDAVETDVGSVTDTRSICPVDMRARNTRENSLLQTIPQHT